MPPRSRERDAKGADFAHIWVYMAGPLIGALVAVAFAQLLRGRGGDRVATRAAQGDSAAEDHREVGTEEA